MCIDRCDIQAFLLFFNLHLLFFRLLLYLHLLILLYLNFLFFNNLIFLLLVLTLLILVNSNDVVEAFLSLNRVVTQWFDHIAKIDKRILLYLCTYNGLYIWSFLCIWLVASDDGQNLICNGMQLLRRLVLHKFVDSSQVVFIYDFVLFGFGTIVDSFVKILSKEVKKNE